MSAADVVELAETIREVVFAGRSETCVAVSFGLPWLSETLDERGVRFTAGELADALGQLVRRRLLNGPSPRGVYYLECTPAVTS